MKKQRIMVTETYSYEIEIEVFDGETIEDAFHETPLLIHRDKEWFEEPRVMHTETTWEELDG